MAIGRGGVRQSAVFASVLALAIILSPGQADGEACVKGDGEAPTACERALAEKWMHTWTEGAHWEATADRLEEKYRFLIERYGTPAVTVSQERPIRLELKDSANPWLLIAGITLSAAAAGFAAGYLVGRRPGR